MSALPSKRIYCIYTDPVFDEYGDVEVYGASVADEDSYEGAALRLSGIVEGGGAAVVVEEFWEMSGESTVHCLNKEDAHEQRIRPVPLKVDLSVIPGLGANGDSWVFLGEDEVAHISVPLLGQSGEASLSVRGRPETLLHDVIGGDAKFSVATGTCARVVGVGALAALARRAIREREKLVSYESVATLQESLEYEGGDVEAEAPYECREVTDDMREKVDADDGSMLVGDGRYLVVAAERNEDQAP